MKLAVFIGKSGVERVVPAGASGLEEVEDSLKLYRLLHAEIEQFDSAIRQRTAVPEKPRRTPSLVEMT